MSQPCDCRYYNHFTSRLNLDFSGLVVVKNTGKPACGCSMKVRVTDIAGTSLVATVSPGASVPIFVECLRSLDIACFKHGAETPVTETCSGEVIFDLEYCITRSIPHRNND
ncbi:S-Ena type endospore appendage [Sporosarcina pasteurii]